MRKLVDLIWDGDDFRKDESDVDSLALLMKKTICTKRMLGKSSRSIIIIIRFISIWLDNHIIDEKCNIFHVTVQLTNSICILYVCLFSSSEISTCFPTPFTFRLTIPVCGSSSNGNIGLISCFCSLISLLFS